MQSKNRLIAKFESEIQNLKKVYRNKSQKNKFCKSLFDEHSSSKRNLTNKEINFEDLKNMDILQLGEILRQQIQNTYELNRSLRERESDLQEIL